MAVTLKNLRPLNAVIVYSQCDDAIDHEASDWERYREDVIKNADALVFLADKVPTKFICNFEFNGKSDAAVKDSMMSGVDRDNNVKMSMGTWQYEVVRRSLKVIENPPGAADVIKLKLESGLYVDKNTMTSLTRAGVSAEIFDAYLKLKEGDDEEKAEAKN